MSLRDIENWMWMNACEILDQANRLHRQFFRPTVDFKIIIILPGVSKEHLNIMLESSHLIINGQRHLPVSAQAQIRRLETPYDRLERRIELSTGHLEIAPRELVNGCLFISLRKI